MKIFSFSGIDGAGKSTQISELQAWLEGGAVRTELRSFWDDVVVLSRWRELMSRKAFKGDQGVGSPDKPLQRRDKKDGQHRANGDDNNQLTASERRGGWNGFRVHGWQAKAVIAALSNTFRTR